MMLTKNIFLIILLAMVLGSGCSLENPAKNSIGLKIFLDEQANSVTNSILDNSFMTMASTTPKAIGDFNCFAVNVTGPGIVSDSKFLSGCTSSDNMAGHGPGVLSKPVPRGTSIELDVPAGKSRNVDVFGIYPPASECGPTTNSGGGGNGYFLGSKALDIIDAASVTVPISFTLGAPASVTCSGGSQVSLFAEFGAGEDGNATITTASINPSTDTTTLSSGRVLAASRRIVAISSSNAQSITLGSSITSSHFQAGDEIMWVVMANDAIASCTSATGELYVGKWGVATVTATTSTTLTISAPIVATPSSLNATGIAQATAASAPRCFIQVVRVPHFANLSLSGSGSIASPVFSYTTGMGGVFAMRINGSLSMFSASNTISSLGFHPSGAFVQGDSSAGVGSGTCSGGANGSGGDCGTNTGGGGGNFGAGGAGNAGGAGGAAMSCSGSLPCAYAGGGGGGANTVTGGDGGGVLFIATRDLNASSSSIIYASGTNGSGTTYGGGGGAGGTIIFKAKSITSAPQIQAKGGDGVGSTGGGGGGGGGRVFADYCSGSAPTVTVSGGIAGTGGTAGSVGSSSLIQSLYHTHCDL